MSNVKREGPLTPCQHDVMRLICKGRSHREIQDSLGVARQTVSDRAQGARWKMGCVNSAEAAANYAQWLLLHDMARRTDLPPDTRAALLWRARRLVPTE